MSKLFSSVFAGLFAIYMPFIPCVAFANESNTKAFLLTQVIAPPLSSSLQDFALQKTKSSKVLMLKLASANLTSQEESDLRNAAHNQTLIHLDIQLLGDGTRESYQAMRDVFGNIAYSLGTDTLVKQAFENVRRTSTESVILELLKNAFVHGNSIHFEYPIFLYLDLAQQTIYVFDIGIHEPISKQQREIILQSHLSGRHKGISFIQLNWAYHIQPIKDSLTGFVIGAQAVAHLEYLEVYNRFDPTKNMASRSVREYSSA